MTQYAQRDHRALGEHYLRHVSAMTGEGLHNKSDIAAELAWRDAEIERLRERLRWRPASEPPDDGREVWVRGIYGDSPWFSTGRFAAYMSMLRTWWPKGGGPITHWRDIEPPEESK